MSDTRELRVRLIAFRGKYRKLRDEFEQMYVALLDAEIPIDADLALGAAHKSFAATEQSISHAIKKL